MQALIRKPAAEGTRNRDEHDGVHAIPRTSSTEHVRENAGALAIELTPRDLVEFDRAFPPPAARKPLEMI